MLKKRLAEMEEAKLLQTVTEGDTQSAAQPQSDAQLARAKAVRPHTRRLEFSEPPVGIPDLAGRPGRPSKIGNFYSSSRHVVR